MAVNELGMSRWWPHGLCARLRVERSGFEPWPRTLRCVLRQDTLYKWVPIRRFQCWGEPCDGLASHPGWSRNILVASCYRNRDKLWPDGPLGLYTDFTFLLPYHCSLNYSCASGFKSVKHSLKTYNRT